MTNTSANHHPILQCLLAETRLMDSLRQLLQDEQLALVDESLDSLNKLMADKAQVLQQLSELEAERLRHLNALGCSSDPAGMESFLQQYGNPELQQGWSQLMQASADARELNHTNGLLINRRMSKNQTALNILQRGNNTGALYGPNGQSTIKSAPGRGVVAR